jgi:hypothetical protein
MEKKENKKGILSTVKQAIVFLWYAFLIFIALLFMLFFLLGSGLVAFVRRK